MAGGRGEEKRRREEGTKERRGNEIVEENGAGYGQRRRDEWRRQRKVAWISFARGGRKNLRHQDSIWAYVVFSSYNLSTAILQRFAPNVLHLRHTVPRDLSKSASTFIRLVAPWLIGPELAELMRPGLN